MSVFDPKAVNGSLSETVYAVLSCDENYAPYASVVIASALATLDSRWKLEFVVLHGGLSQEATRRLKRLECSRLAVRLLDLSGHEEVRSLPEIGHWSIAMYYRFFVDKAFEAHVGRAIYLDCDVLVMRSLHHLFREDLGGASLGVVENPGTHRLGALGIRCNQRYFNSGVLVVDLGAIRKMPILQMAMDVAYRLRDNLVNPDQDILNILFDGDVQFLDFRWNVQVSMYGRWCYDIESLAKPWIVHFTTQLKPWCLDDPHPHARVYRLFSAESGLVAKPFTARGRVRFPIRLFRRYRVFYTRLAFNRFLLRIFNSHAAVNN